MATITINGQQVEVDENGNGLMPDGSTIQVGTQNTNALNAPGWDNVAGAFGNAVGSIFKPIGNLFGLGSNNSFPAYDVWQKDRYPDGFANPAQRTDAINQYNMERMLNNFDRYSWLGPASFGLNLAGTVANTISGFKQLGMAKDMLNKQWSVTKNNFNNNVEALRSAWRARAATEDWFGGGANKSTYDPNSLKKIGE